MMKMEGLDRRRRRPKKAGNDCIDRHETKASIKKNHISRPPWGGGGQTHTQQRPHLSRDDDIAMRNEN